MRLMRTLCLSLALSIALAVSTLSFALDQSPFPSNSDESAGRKGGKRKAIGEAGSTSKKTKYDYNNEQQKISDEINLQNAQVQEVSVTVNGFIENITQIDSFFQEKLNDSPLICAANFDLRQSLMTQINLLQERLYQLDQSTRSFYKSLNLSIPHEIWQLVINFCDNTTLLNLRGTNQMLHKIVEPHLKGYMNIVNVFPGRYRRETLDKVPLLQQLRHFKIDFEFLRSSNINTEAFEDFFGGNALNKDNIESLALSFFPLRAKDIKALSSLPNLKELQLRDVVKGSFLKNLKNSHLQHLTLKHMGEEIPIEVLSDLSRLTQLDIITSRINFPSTSTLIHFPQLKSLNFEGISIMSLNINRMICRNLTYLKFNAVKIPNLTGVTATSAPKNDLNFKNSFPKLEHLSCEIKFDSNLGDIVLPHTLKLLELNLYNSNQIALVYPQFGHLQLLNSLRIKINNKVDLTDLLEKISELPVLRKLILSLPFMDESTYEAMDHFKQFPYSLKFFALMTGSRKKYPVIQNVRFNTDVIKKFIEKIAVSSTAPEMFTASLNEICLDIIQEGQLCNPGQPGLGISSQSNFWNMPTVLNF